MRFSSSTASGLKLTTIMLVLSLHRGLQFPFRTASRFSSSKVLGATSVVAEAALGLSSAPAQHPSYDMVEESMITEYGCKAILYR
jgi:hypothetical protein